MQIENKQLLDFLGEVDKELPRMVSITAVGGTAMTLLKLKTSTIDIDFNLNKEDNLIFRNALKIIQPGFKIDLFVDGLIFSQQLPDDYSQKTILIKTTLQKIKLSALHPIDIIATN
ncbi:MAG: hypothetical protein ABH821_03420 [archaeon]